jgi:polar amino acid transport system permease protein
MSGADFLSVAEGIPVALQVSLLAWALSAAFGAVLLALGSQPWRAARMLSTTTTVVVRGIPEMVALLFLFYGIAEVVQLSPVTAAVLALGFTHGPYCAEVFRAALATVGSDQREAARAIGLPRRHTIASVVLPQAARFSLAPMINVLVGLTKLASLTGLIGVSEIVFRAEDLTSTNPENATLVASTLYIIFAYLLLTLPITALGRVMETRLRGTRALG